MKPWILLGGLNGLLAVAASAYGYHALDNNDLFMMGAGNQMTHALALIATGVLAHLRPDCKALTIAGWGFFGGIVLFSGTLYGMTMTDLPPIPNAAPIGGYLLMMGWGGLAWVGWKHFRA